MNDPNLYFTFLANSGTKLDPRQPYTGRIFQRKKADKLTIPWRTKQTVITQIFSNRLKKHTQLKHFVVPIKGMLQVPADGSALGFSVSGG